MQGGFDSLPLFKILHMETAMQKMSKLIKWRDIELKTFSIALQEEEKQQIIDAYAYGFIHSLLIGEKTDRTIDELGNEYYQIFFEPKNLNHDDKV